MRQRLGPAIHPCFGRQVDDPIRLKVEALVKYSRANLLTPVPHAPSFEALNAGLEERCRARQNERAGRHEQTIGGRLVADRAVLRPLPEAPFEPCDKRPVKVSSTALVRYRMNDYSSAGQRPRPSSARAPCSTVWHNAAQYRSRRCSRYRAASRIVGSATGVRAGTSLRSPTAVH
jgi:hypothetical protein